MQTTEPLAQRDALKLSRIIENLHPTNESLKVEKKEREIKKKKKERKKEKEKKKEINKTKTTEPLAQRRSEVIKNSRKLATH